MARLPPFSAPTFLDQPSGSVVHQESLRSRWGIQLRTPMHWGNAPRHNKNPASSLARACPERQGRIGPPGHTSIPCRLGGRHRERRNPTAPAAAKHFCKGSSLLKQKRFERFLHALLAVKASGFHDRRVVLQQDTRRKQVIRGLLKPRFHFIRPGRHRALFPSL